jgi:hypothetical protein
MMVLVLTALGKERKAQMDLKVVTLLPKWV